MENDTGATPTVVNQNYSSLYVPGAIIIAALIVAGGLYFGLARSSNTAGGPDDNVIAVNIKDVKTNGEDPFIGAPNAPVVMAAWEDYQCPFCQKFEVDVLPSLMEKYVNTGKLKIVFKDFAFLSEDSTTAAEYARAVWDLYPAEYAAFRAALYHAQDEEHGGFGNPASIDTLIKKQFPQMNVAQIRAQIVAKKEAYATIIGANQSEGQSFGVNGTPGFIVGKTLINGAQPVSSFTAAIDAEL